MRTEVDGRLLHPQDVDPLEQGARQELTTGAAFSLVPRLRQVLDVADRDFCWDVVPSLTSLGRRLFLVEASHRLLEGFCDPIGRQAIRSRRVWPERVDRNLPSGENPPGKPPRATSSVCPRSQ